MLHLRSSALHTHTAPSHTHNGTPLLSSRLRVAGRRALVAPVRATDNEEGGISKGAKDNLVIYGTAIGLTGLATLCATVWRDPIADWFFDQAINGDGGEFLGVGDIVGGLLWGVSLYFASPLQLLLLFLGRMDTSRPSDAVLRLLGLATGQRVDDVDYECPQALKAVAYVGFALSGLGISYLFKIGLGDPTWSCSSGVGACMAAGVYEVGRPKRLSAQDAIVLENQWQDFAAFASQKLQKSGRCHESEVYKQFRRAYARYRSEEVISDDVLRDMVRNFHPAVDRSSTGYLKNLSLKPGVDAFGVPVGSVEASGGSKPEQSGSSLTS